jgi:hypothetical protein
VKDKASNHLGIAPTAPLLSIVRCRFLLEAQEPVALPNYAGSAWRGLLGHGLRRLVCVTRQPTCDGCMLRYTCLYSTFFETPAPPTVPERRYKALPHPFILEPEIIGVREIPEGGALRLGITLMGPAIEHAPYLIHALNLAGQRGLGRGRGRCKVTALEREETLGGDRWEQVYSAECGEFGRRETSAPAIPAAPAKVRLRLLTPLRIKRHGRFVGVREFAAADLLRNLYARLAVLTALYAHAPDQFPWRSVRDQAERVHIASSQLRWYEWTRFSSRQNTRMQMGGLLGELELTGPGLKTFWPALWLGQWVHVGKGSSFGLGGYRLEPLPIAS